jgi:hypothetical protein
LSIHFSKVGRELRTERGGKEWHNNLARALAASNVFLEDFELRNIEITDVRAQMIYWRAADMTNVIFDVAELETVRFDAFTLCGVSFVSPISRFVAEGDSQLDCIINSARNLTVKITNSTGKVLLKGGAEFITLDESSIEL